MDKGERMKRKLLIILCCTLPVFFSAFVFAQTGPYLSATIGTNNPIDSDVTDSTMPGITTEISYDTGFALGAAIGYGFGNFRVEGEVSYAKSDIDQTSVLGMSFDSTGDATATSLLLNAYYDFTNTSAFTPYVSGGVGFSKIDVNDYNILGSGDPDFTDDDTVFAYQVGVGVGYAVNNQITIDLKYRYFATEDSELDTTKAEIASHNLLLGVRFNF